MEKLKALIKQKYNNLEWFARKVGLSQSMVYNILNGRRHLMWYHWTIWGEVLGIKPDQYREYFPFFENDRVEYLVEMIKSDIEMYKADCDLGEEDADCLMCTENVFKTIEKIIDKHYREVKGYGKADS